MARSFQFVLFSALLLTLSSWAQMRYSTGGVTDYPTKTCGGPSLALAVPEARDFQTWYNLAGFHNVTRWENGDVWGSDFRDGTDLDASGGSDIAQIYFFTGHGICQKSPQSMDPDYMVTCGNYGKPDVTNIGNSSHWGNSTGTLQFMFIDASCPMDLVSLDNNWFSPFKGLNMATGHSGNKTHDTLDSETRGSEFAVYTVGFPLIPKLTVGTAWMDTGLIDVQSGVCAVAIAAGKDCYEAINVRDNAYINSGWVPYKPTANCLAYEFVCE